VHNCTCYQRDVFLHLLLVCCLPKLDLIQGATQDCTYLALREDTSTYE